MLQGWETPYDLTDAIPVGIVVWSANGSIQYSNRRAAEIIGRPMARGTPTADATAAFRLVRSGAPVSSPQALLIPASVFQGEVVSFRDLEFEHPDGSRRRAEGSTSPVPDRDGVATLAVTTLIDVTDAHRASVLAAAAAQVLEMVAADAPLPETLATLARLFEAQSEGMLASVLLLEHGRLLRHAAGPSLPAAFMALVDGQPIGPNQGSCGTAAHHKQPVIVADIASDPRWEPYRDAALTAGLRACWSTPVLGQEGRVLGTFAFYYTERREPTARLLDLAERASRLAAVAIQHHLRKLELEQSLADVLAAKLHEQALRTEKEAAEAATRAKSLFLAQMSHEIRTPLNAILGYAQLLLRDPEVNSERRRHIDVIHSNGQHLSTLINDMLRDGPQHALLGPPLQRQQAPLQTNANAAAALQDEPDTAGELDELATLADERPAEASPLGNILVVDDTLENLRLLSSILGECGYEVRPVTNGRLALQAVERDPPDLVLLDINMPDMNGYEVCQQLKARPELRDVPVIFLTALGDVADKVKAFDVGGVDYITKPFQLEEVQARVKTHIALRRAGRELAASYERLRSLEKLRDELVHMVVHDMRSPLTVMLGHLKLLESEEGAALSENARGDLRAATSAAHSLNRMANELLDVSRLEAGRLELKRDTCDLLALAEEVRASFNVLDRGRSLELGLTGAVPVSCDVALLRRVLENLVSNAIKHTPSGTRVRITVTASAGRARVTIEDRGPGVPVASRLRIFEKFETVAARAENKYHSVGLGLAFCKLAVEAHGGSIGVDAAEPQGSIFWFELPL